MDFFKIITQLLAPSQRNRAPAVRKNRSYPVRTASGTTAHASQPQKRYDAAFMQGLDQAIQKFKHDSLAYFIYEAANEQGLSTSAIEKLFEQYGRYSIKPSFLPYLPNQMESDSRLVVAVSDWFKNNGIDSSTSRWESEIEKYVWSSTKKEAGEIVSRIKNDSNASV